MITAVFILCLAGLAAAAETVPGEALVLLKNGVGDLTAASIQRSAGEGYVRTTAGKAGARVVKTFEAISEESGEIFVHMKSEALSTEALIAQLQDDPNVLCASPNYVRRSNVVPNDTYYASDSQWGPKRIGAEQAWGLSTGSSSVHVAVIDSGIQSDHPDLQANVDTGRSRNFSSSGSGNDDKYGDGNGHGTHVSGILGAVGNNGIGIAGLNWTTRIIALKMLNDNGYGTTAMEVAAINYLVGVLRNNSNLKLPAVNFSLGGWDDYTPTEALNSTTWQAYKTLDSLNRAVIVVAASNESAEVGAPAPFDIRDSSGSLVASKGEYCYPASYLGLDNMIVVGSIDSDDSGSYFTNWSSRYVHLAAPGGSIISTTNDGGYESWSGTSMAAPHVTGAIALLASVYPDWTASELKSHVLRNADSGVNPLAPAKIGSAAVTPQNVSDTTLSRYGMLDVRNLLTSSSREVRVDSIALRGTSTMTAGESRIFGVQVLPEDATDKRVTWDSSDTDVASVTSGGRVTARSAGVTVIRATARDGSRVSGTMLLTVKSDIWEDLFGSGGGCAAGGAAGMTALALAAVLICKQRRR